MLKKIAFLLSLSLFWPVLSILSDGVNTLFLPQRLAGIEVPRSQAVIAGGLTFTGLLAGMLVQPFAGAWSDRLKPRWGRKALLLPGSLLVLLSLAVLVLSSNLTGVAAGYILLQLGLSIIQAAQQGFIPDQAAPSDRGLASGIKNFMDIGGAMVGFVLLGQVLGQGRTGLAGWIMGGLTVTALALTFLWIREPRGPQPSLTPVHIYRGISLRIDFQRHSSFVWLVISRFFFLLGTYAVGRFLLLFVSTTLDLSANKASELAGNLLAVLVLVTVITAPFAGKLADRMGRRPLMLFGALISAAGVIGYIFAIDLIQIVLFGCLLSVGSAAFASANWAMAADLVPQNEAARFFGLANFGTAGASAAAGLFGFLVDPTHATQRGFSLLFIASTGAFLLSALVLRGIHPAAPYLRHETTIQSPTVPPISPDESSF